MKSISLTFLKQNRVSMMETILKYPLLFVEDYENVNHEIFDAIANHETSFSSRNNNNNNDKEEIARTTLPARKRRDTRSSME